MAERSISSFAGEKVVANSDLLFEILIRLPIKSLMIFKLVSKHWLSIITSHFFALLHNPDSSIVSGLFLQTCAGLNFIPLINTIETPAHDPHSRFTDFSFFPAGLPAHVQIINSCHGLLLCSSVHHHDYKMLSLNKENHNYIILNPTTKQFKILPRCHIVDLICLTLAFDPSISPHYKVVCVHKDFDRTHQEQSYRLIMTYSSNTGSWKASALSFPAKYENQYTVGVYWNGAVHWFNNISRFEESLYYNVDNEQLGDIPPPPIPEGMDRHYKGRGRFRHYGESRGHLHLVEVFGWMHMPRVDVYELEGDYSRWFLKFSVDLEALGIPRATRFGYIFSVLCVVRMERDEESLLVLHLPGKVLRYTFGDGKSKEICDVPIPPTIPILGLIQSPLMYTWFCSFQYIESLFGV